MSSDPAPFNASPEPEPVPCVPSAGEDRPPVWPPGTAKLVTFHWPRLRAIALRVVRDADIASDLAQEAIFRYLKAPIRYPEGSLYKPILHWLLLDWLRQRKRHPAVGLDTLQEVDALTATGPDALAELVATDEYARVQRALSQLPPAAADLLRRHYLQGEPTKEIAVDLGIGDGAVRTRIHRAVIQLRAVIQRS